MLYRIVIGDLYHLPRSTDDTTALVLPAPVPPHMIERSTLHKESSNCAQCVGALQASCQAMGLRHIALSQTPLATYQQALATAWEANAEYSQSSSTNLVPPLR